MQIRPNMINFQEQSLWFATLTFSRFYLEPIILNRGPSTLHSFELFIVFLANILTVQIAREIYSKNIQAIKLDLFGLQADLNEWFLVKILARYQDNFKYAFEWF